MFVLVVNKFGGCSKLCLVVLIGLGGGGGDLPQLAMPNTHIFHFQNRETHFRRCPMLPSLPSNTKHSVDLYHALTPMLCDILVHNAMQL